ncbi:hypothetical protein Tco_1045488 [Tanacetum coccineum]|uniref:Uncharacterized protein n=1 Tax=Tanacetum coccineum TaxID=301880 RepID=A0ABQ5GSX5_9ASTR
MGDTNPIRTLGDYFKPSHEGYMNTIELPVGNNVVPLRSDTIRLITILKTNTTYPSRRYGISVLALTKRPQKIKDQYAVSRGLNTPYSRHGINIIFWKISNVVPTLRNPQYAVSNPLDTPY